MAYSVSKAAGLHLMKALASTQGSKIRVNALLPGLILTEWVRSLGVYRPFYRTNFELGTTVSEGGRPYV